MFEVTGPVVGETGESGSFVVVGFEVAASGDLVVPALVAGESDGFVVAGTTGVLLAKIEEGASGNLVVVGFEVGASGDLLVAGLEVIGTAMDPGTVDPDGGILVVVSADLVPGTDTGFVGLLVAEIDVDVSGDLLIGLVVCTIV